MREKLKMISAMLIVGTIGIFVTYIPLPSSFIAGTRAVVGTIFLLLVMAIKKSGVHWEAVKKNGGYLLLSGAALGFNWILLFEAYQYTTVAVATLCYYMAPVFVVLLSPIVLREKLTLRKLVGTMAAVAGAVLISGAVGGDGQNFKGVGFGLAAAVLYCSIILLNKKIKGMEDLEKTLCQLAISAAVMIPYVLCTQKLGTLSFSSKTVVLLLIVGVVHTGVTYLLFFSAIGKLPAQTSSVLSYVDPVTAILVSAVLLQQPLGLWQICGTVLILGSTLMNELLTPKTSGVA